MEADNFISLLKENKELAWDVETNGLKWTKNKIVGYGISNGKDAFYVPVRHANSNINNAEQFEKEVAKIVKERTAPLIAHSAKFDMHFSENQGIKIQNIVDTMVMEALLDENRRSYSLENVCKSYKVEQKKGSELYAHIADKFGVKPDRSSLSEYHRLDGDDPIAVDYAKQDSISTYQLYQAQKKPLYEQGLDAVVGLENHLTYVLQKMERRGVITDLEETQKVKTEVEELYWEAYSKIPVGEDHEGNFKSINVRSGKDLKEYFEFCEIDDWPVTAPTERFPNGQPSFNKQWLALSDQGRNILNVRKYAHLKNSFLDVLDQHIYNNKIHTTFNQTRGETHGTRSGRLSSSWPNMQQVPKRDKTLGKVYRRLFVAPTDYVFVEFDYSQAEPRLFTHYSNEPALLEGYLSDPPVDMYDVFGQACFGRSIYNREKHRDMFKTIGLGVMYTMGAEKLGASLGMSYDEALGILKHLTRIFPRMLGRDRSNPGFTEKASKVAAERGYVKTILGRRSRFDDPKYSYRAANRIVQGGSADILKYKMCRIDEYLVRENLEEVCQMVLTIHDAVAFYIHKDYLHLINEIKNILERVQVPPFNLKIPFIAEHKSGKNWSEASYGVST
jgi:DNA polymerase-1